MRTIAAAIFVKLRNRGNNEKKMIYDKKIRVYILVLDSL